MAEGSGGSKSGGLLPALVALFQQWQVMVAAIAAATALWFGFDDQRRKQLEINRTAVEAAKTQARLAEFRADPLNALVEFRATYPEHAFCAVLGYYVAEAGRLVSDPSARASLKPIGDAIGVQIDRLAAAGGSSLEALQDRAIAAAGTGGAQSNCPRLDLDLAWFAPARMWPDCRLVLATFAQAQCQTEAVRLAAAIAPPVVMPLPPAPVQVPTSPGSGGDAGDAGDGGERGDANVTSPETELPPPVAAARPAPEVAARAPGPGEACGAAPPTVYIQFVAEANRSEVGALAGELRDAGWIVADGVDLEADARTSGDVRFYWPEQEPCAVRLAEALGVLMGQPFATISLAGKFRNLPRGRMEAWLPAF